MKIDRHRFSSQVLGLGAANNWRAKVSGFTDAVVSVPMFSCMAAFMLGSLTVLGYAPFHLFLLPVITLAGLFGLVLQQASPMRAALAAFCFGLGMFGTGVSWIYVSLQVYGGMSVPLAVISTIGFCAFLALFPALFGAVSWFSRYAGAWLRILTVPGSWVAAEWLRGVVFTGFPWLAVGYSQGPASLLGNYAAMLGVYGVSALVATSAFLLLRLMSSRITPKKGLVVLLIGIWSAGWLLQQVAWTSPAGQPFPVSLIQGNIAQDQKWRPDQLAATLQIYRSLLERSDGRLIVMPETALPLFAGEIPAAYTDALTAQAKENDADVIIGVPEQVVENGQLHYYNSALSMGVSPTQTYRKQHLVPFGEYLPAKPLLGWVLDILRIPLADMSPGGAMQAPLQLAGEKIAINICFEDVFGEEIIRALPKATLLVNLSNLAWFGDSLALPQHLQIAQMRAMETGRYMLRATNTGMTAIIDERGRVVKQAKPLEEQVLSGLVQGFTGATPYVSWGNLPVLAWSWAATLLILVAGIRRYRTKRADQ